MNKLPYVTIIIPYKNNLDYLFIALKSILKQSYKNFKILIIYDDEDRSDLSKIKKFFKSTFVKKRISFEIIVNKNSLGAGYARNVGIKKSRTKYIAFIDSDDVWVKNKLKTQINFMEKNNIEFSHTSYFIINAKNKIISSQLAKKKIVFQDLIASCDIGLSTVILKSNLLNKNKLLFPKIETKEDYILWLKIVKKIKTIKGLDTKLTYYRKTKGSLSSSKLISLINGYKVYRYYMNFGVIKSLIYLFALSVNSLKKKTGNYFNS
jgi:teichuronic acid biosynthesis glycosyltransferase TuaG